MRISADGKEQPALRDIAFVTPFAKKCSKSRANPNGTATSEIPGTLYVIQKIFF
jgi:hypothetical protein